MPKSQETLTKRQKIKQERLKKQKRQRLITILVVICVAIVVVGLMIYSSLVPKGKSSSNYPNAQFNAMGDPNAPVKIEEYSDFQCPYCQMFSQQTEGLIVENYVATGKVYFVFNPYGPGGLYIGPESEAAAKAAFCAGSENKFWEYKELLYNNLTGENVGDFTEERLKAFAEEIGLDMERFNTCYAENQYAKELQEINTTGMDAGIDATPSFLINGKLIVGALPYEEFEKEIEAALAAAGQ